MPTLQESSKTDYVSSSSGPRPQVHDLAQGDTTLHDVAEELDADVAVRAGTNGAFEIAGADRGDAAGRDVDSSEGADRGGAAGRDVDGSEAAERTKFDDRDEARGPEGTARDRSLSARRRRSGPRRSSSLTWAGGS